ncbi:hypothetical protein BT63DRAFT_16516 [Microthyrium microscopicum]|uniref:Autophagy-related protein 29 n=1 Tax=Microthyrium microscopicum TaxID=703497 RepID=A0A6A6UT85_9PEZI|nr:hypothetical protein BT63DRAFT_16516 [Microthyrium microscopicum]
MAPEVESSRRDFPSTKPHASNVSNKPPVRYTLIVRLPFARGDFVDPQPVNWDAAKDRKLWKLISRTGTKLSNRGPTSSASASEGGAGSANEVDWEARAAEFGVDTRFLLQQAAWLYERHLEHVKKQVVRLRAGSTAGTPVPGQTSMLGKKSALQPGSRAPSAMSGRSRDSPLPKVDNSIANTASRPSALSRTPSTNTITQSRLLPTQGNPSSPRIRSARPSSIRRQTGTLANVKPPGEGLDSPGVESDSSSSSSSDENVGQMSRSVAAFRRPPRFGAKRHAALLGHDGDDENETDEDEDDEPTFLSYAQVDGTSKKPSDPDMGDTLKDGLAKRGFANRHGTTAENSESNTATIPTTTTGLKQPKPTRPVAGEPIPSQEQQQPQTIRSPGVPTESSVSSASSAATPARRTSQIPSPRHRADLARLSSPRRHTGETSDGTPSMGSSFSDLDDASLTQSALEEALASNFRNGGASRLSNISHAFRSRYMQ